MSESSLKSDSRLKIFFRYGNGHPLAVAIVIFLCAFAARIIFYLIFQRADRNYMAREIGVNNWLEIARNLASGHGYTCRKLLTYFPVDSLKATAARGPVPVLILSLLITFFSGPIHVFLIYSWGLSALTAVFLYFLSRKLLGSQTLARATALIYCFYLPEMYISTVYAAASESLFALLLMTYFYMVIKSIEPRSSSGAFLAGILAGVATLTRPLVFPFPFFYFFLAFRKHRGKSFPMFAMFFLAFLACLGPWTIRNQAVFGKPVFLTTLGGYNLLRHNYGIGQNDYRLHTTEDFDPVARNVVAASGRPLEQMDEPRLDRIFRNEAIRIIGKYPLRYLKLCLIRTGWLWYKIGAEKSVYRIQNIVIYLFMFPGILLALTRPNPLRIFAFHFLYFLLAYAAVNAQFRFICPMMPYGIMIAVHTASVLFKRPSTASLRTH